jgi:hypothetical protein
MVHFNQCWGVAYLKSLSAHGGVLNGSNMVCIRQRAYHTPHCPLTLWGLLTARFTRSYLNDPLNSAFLEGVRVCSTAPRLR